MVSYISLIPPGGKLEEKMWTSNKTLHLNITLGLDFNFLLSILSILTDSSLVVPAAFKCKSRRPLVAVTLTSVHWLVEWLVECLKDVRLDAVRMTPL